jgi:hypothetical protein
MWCSRLQALFWVVPNSKCCWKIESDIWFQLISGGLTKHFSGSGTTPPVARRREPHFAPVKPTPNFGRLLAEKNWVFPSEILEPFIVFYSNAPKKWNVIDHDFSRKLIVLSFSGGATICQKLAHWPTPKLSLVCSGFGEEVQSKN